jgi:MoaA/NifB/PqqE/SkfB family radical SAM enzyme
MVAIIIPTNRCNLRCKHCLRAHYEGEDLKLDDLKKFLQGFEEYHLGNEFSITGGEPTLHDNFFAILRMLKEYDFKNSSIVTNGQNIEKIRRLGDFKEIFNHILLSLEGPNPLINDKIRGKGSFDKAMETIKILNNKQIPIHIRTTLNSININCVEEMIHFSMENGISLMHFSTIHPCAKGEKNDLHLTQKEMEDGFLKYTKIVSRYPNLRSIYSNRNFRDFTDPEWRSYEMCRPIKKGPYGGELVLKPNGLVSFCCDLSDYDFYTENYNSVNKNKYDHILGDIRKDAFGMILERRKELINKLIGRRMEDSLSGELKGRRRFICENCKFYFFYHN